MKDKDLLKLSGLGDFDDFDTDFNFEKFDVQTKTFSDSVPKKGIFGRLKDAFAGKETVRKDFKSKDILDYDRQVLKSIEDYLKSVKVATTE